MNAERLRAVLSAVRNELDQEQVADLLSQVNSALANQVNQPQQPSHQQQLANALTRLNSQLEGAPSNGFSPLWRQLLEEIGVADKIGAGLKAALEGIFSRNQITPAVARDEVAKLHGAVAGMKAAIDSVLNGFGTLNIGMDDIKSGECEIGILVPRTYVKNDLWQFGKELEELDGILETFAELSTGSRPGFSIRSISSSELSVFLQSHASICAAIAFAAERILKSYKTLLEVRKLHTELRQQNVPPERLAGVEEHASGIMNASVDQVADELLKGYFKGKDKGRKHEMRTALRFALKKIANRIDRGFNIEIRIAPIQPSEAAEDEAGEAALELKKYEETIQSAARELRFLRVGGEPILFLTEDAAKRRTARSKKAEPDAEAGSGEGADGDQSAEQ